MKNLVKSKRAEGFTIIEVMIVLAIAGLIMVVVFIAVPQLQRAQRDNARQALANRVKSEMENYAGNNQGLYPFNTTACAAAANNTGKVCDFVNRYVGTGTGPATTCNPNNGRVNTCDPSLGTPVMTGAANATGKPIACGIGSGADGQSCVAAVNTDLTTITKGQFYVIYGAKCSGEGVVSSGYSTGANATSVRNYAIVIGLDRDTTDYCVDNG